MNSDLTIPVGIYITLNFITVHMILNYYLKESITMFNKKKELDEKEKKQSQVIHE
jgi:hypothetical protein